MGLAVPSRGSRTLRTRALLGVCLAGLLLLTASCAAGANLVILNTVVKPSSQPPQSQRAFDAQNAGLLAALYAVNYQAADGRTIVLEDVADADDLPGSLTTALNTYGADLLTATAPLLLDQIVDLQNSAAFLGQSITLFNPYASGFAIRHWTKDLYFTSADPSAELLAQLLYLVSELRVRRVGFVYLSGIGMGEDELALVKKQLASAGLPDSSLSIYTVPYVVTDTTYDQAAFDAFAATQPQAILYFASPGLHSLALCEALFSDARTSSAYVLTPSMLLDLTYQCTSAMVDTVKAGQVIMSSTTVLASETDYLHVQQFQKEMKACIEDGQCPQFTTDDGDIFLTDPSLGQMLLYSWIGGKVLTSTLMRGDYVASREAYQDGIFQVNTAYVIGQDLLLGSYGGVCPAALQNASNAQCECNQGGRSAYLSTAVVTNGAINFSPLPDNTFTYSNFQCYSSDAYSIPAAVGTLVLGVTDDARLNSVTQQSVATTKALANTLNAGSSATTLFSTFLLEGTNAAFPDLIATQTSEFMVAVVLGPVPTTFPFDNTSLTVLDPTYSTVAPRVNNTNAIYLFPTLEQETFVIYSDLYNASLQGLVDVNNISLILKDVPSARAEGIISNMKKVAETFDLPEATVKYVAAGESMKSYFTSLGADVIIGSDESDVDDMVQHLIDNPSAMAFICSQDFYRLYTTLIAKFSVTDVSVMARVMALSSLPLWAYDDAHTTSAMARAFHAATTDRTPLAFQSFIELTFLQQVMASASTSDVAQAVYDAGTITINGMVFGPFVQSCQGTLGTSCTPTNYGATAIGGFSILGLLSPEVGYTFAPMTPSMVYKERTTTSSGLSTGAIAGIVVAAVVVVAGIIVLIVVLLCCCNGSSRDNKNAPKALEYPVTLVFTDIESSTAMWAACPTIMPDAVATHHKLIRQLIADYKCYEVKTIGDSFMIACKNAIDGVRLARDIQVKFLKHDWKAPEIDDAYRKFEQRKVDEVELYKAPTATLSPDVYASLWNGLRVRIGIHTGLSDIRQDETTGGFDYYGETSNMAARTEAIGNGGQIIMTESTWWALSDDERDLMDYRNLGPQGLRGVPFNVEMYQLNAVVGRRYAALRTEIDAILPDVESMASEDGTEALLSSADALNGPASNIAFVLTNTFAPYPAARRVKELTPLMEKWSIGVPPRSRNVNEDDYCRGLINRLAIKMSTILQMRNNIGSGTGTPLMPGGAVRGSTLNVLSPTYTPPMRGHSSDERIRTGELSAAQVATLSHQRINSVRPLGVHHIAAALPPSPRKVSNSGADLVVPFRRTSMSVSAVNVAPLSVMDESIPEVELRGVRQQRHSRRGTSGHGRRVGGGLAEASPDETVFVRMPAEITAREEAEAAAADAAADAEEKLS